MASIFSVSPPENVNKGLATEFNPMYPEQIALMQQKQEKDQKQASQDRAIQVQNMEWIDSKEVDTEKLPDYEIQDINNSFDAVYKKFSEDNKNNLDPMLNPNYGKELLDIANRGERYRKSSLMESHLVTETNKNGAYDDFADQAAVRQMILEEREAAKKEGRVANFDNIIESTRAWSEAKLSKSFNEARQFAYDQKLDEIAVDGSNESVLQLKKYIKADIWEREEDGSYKYDDNKNRIIKAEPTPEFLEDVKADERYYKKLKAEAADSDMTWQEKAYQNFLRTNDIESIENMTRTTDTGNPSGPELEKANARELTSQVVKALTPGDPTGTADQVLSSLSKGGLDFKRDGSKVTATITKQFLDKLDTTGMFLMAAEMGVDIGTGDDPEAVKKLMTKTVESGAVDLKIDLTNGFNAGVARIIKIASLNKGENAIIAMNKYLEEVSPTTKDWYKAKKKTSMFKGTPYGPPSEGEDGIIIFDPEG